MRFELLKRVVAELSERLAGARVDRIHQPSADLLTFRLWTGKENVRLLISTDPRAYRIHLTQAAFPNPFTPPRFCQLLRARVDRFHKIAVLNDDRIVSIHFTGSKGSGLLVVELTGNNSNLILVDENNLIIDALHRISGPQEGRQVAPGKLYQLPVKREFPAGSEGGRSPDDQEGSINERVDKFYRRSQFTEKKTDLASILASAVSRQQKKLSKRLKKIGEEREKQENYHRLKQLGELLLANLHLVKKGEKTVEVTDYYLQPPEPVTIELDPRLSPQENAERYFVRYKKARRGLEHSNRRLMETEEELQWLDSIAFQLQEASGAGEIEGLAIECRQQGLLRQQKDRFGKKRVEIVSVPQEATSPNGYKILWGRNNRQNDQVTSKIMKTGDLWFHAHQCPGAHVVLKGQNQQTDFLEEDTLFAASLAAGYSKSRSDNKVEVMVAEPTNVQKIKGGRPGMVTVKKYKTLVVEPFRLD